jgi:hypothetical protein
LKIAINELYPHWFVVGLVALSILGYLGICLYFGDAIQDALPEGRRVLIRTTFYALAIVSFPLANLIRHVQIRLNQTVPGSKSARSRYLMTVIVSMAIVEIVAGLGLVMFLLGDGFNTLYIFLGLAALGVYHYRPKEEEYVEIVEALAVKTK